MEYQFGRRIGGAVAIAALIALSLSGTALAADQGKAKPPPRAQDSDHDGMPDTWERANGLNPGAKDATGDPDRDKLTNLVEYRAGTKPRTADTDHDTMPDGWEVANHLDPVRADASADPDRDGLSNRQELTLSDRPRNADSDHDGTIDGAEDHDNDGLSDRDEFRLGDDPRSADSDRDGTPDGQEKEGIVVSFDAGTGELTLTAAAERTITVTVTANTEITWKHQSGRCPLPAAVTDLSPGRIVRDLDIHQADAPQEHKTGAGDHAHEPSFPAGLVVDRIRLACS